MKKIIVAIVSMTIPLSAFAETSVMKCYLPDSVNQVGAIVTYRIPLQKKVVDENGTIDFSSQVVVTHLDGRKKVFAKSWGWVNSRKEFYVSLCDSKVCVGGLSGRMKTPKKFSAEYIKISDNIDSPVRSLICELL